MKNLIKGALIRVAIATVVAAGVGTLTSRDGRGEHSIVPAAAAANPRCAPHPVKMPCLQPNA